MKNIVFSKYCTPAYLNIALGVAIIIGTFLAGLKTEMLVAEVAFIGIWALGLKWLCSNGYKIISWSLAVVPVIIALYMVLLVKNGIASKEGIDNKNPSADMPAIAQPSTAVMSDVAPALACGPKQVKLAPAPVALAPPATMSDAAAPVALAGSAKNVNLVPDRVAPAPVALSGGPKKGKPLAE